MSMDDTDSVPWTLRAFIDRLAELGASFRLDRFRDSIAVIVVVPGERWEVEFMDDGSIEVERFRRSGEVDDEKSFDELFDLVT